jgi:hypothetical protein
MSEEQPKPLTQEELVKRVAELERRLGPLPPKLTPDQVLRQRKRS